MAHLSASAIYFALKPKKWETAEEHNEFAEVKDDQSMIPQSGTYFSEKIMLKQGSRAAI